MFFLIILNFKHNWTVLTDLFIVDSQSCIKVDVENPITDSTDDQAIEANKDDSDIDMSNMQPVVMLNNIEVSRRRSLKRPAALRDYVTEDKENDVRYDDKDESEVNEKYLVGKVQKAYQNLKRVQTVFQIYSDLILHRNVY